MGSRRALLFTFQLQEEINCVGCLSCGANYQTVAARNGRELLRGGVKKKDRPKAVSLRSEDRG